MGDRTFRSDSASESASSAVTDGAGATGGSTGVAAMPCMAAAGTTPGATRFTTAVVSIEEAPCAVELTARLAELVAGRMERSGLLTEPSRDVAQFPMEREHRPGLSTETLRLLVDMPRPAVRPAFARAPSAATLRADRQEAIPHAETPASVVERLEAVEGLAVAEDFTAAVVAVDRAAAAVGIVSRSFVLRTVDREI